MNLLIDLLPANGWPRFLADAAWQSTLAGVAGPACIQLFARRPATRAGLCLWAILAAVALPLVSAGARQAGWGVLKPAAVAPPVESEPAAGPVRTLNDLTSVYRSTESQERGGPQTTSVLHDRPPPATPLQTAPPNSESVSSGFRAATILVASWFILSAALLVRLLASARQTRRLLREAVPCDDRTVTTALQAAAERLRIAAPRVLECRAMKTPTVFAFGRGVVLVPASQPTSSPATSNAADDRTSAYDRWFAILSHELGHVRRRDGWNRLAVEIAVVVLPWQPLVWLLRREFLRHAEEACDDWAVANGVNPIDFASVLTDFVPTATRLNLGATIMNTDAKSRILRLLALRETPRPRTTWLQLTAVATAACAIVTGVALAQRPADKNSQTGKNQPSAPTATDATKNREGAKPEAVDYMLEPSDIVTIDVLRLVPKAPYRIRAIDILQVDVEGDLPEHRIDNMLFTIAADGTLNLGSAHGKVNVAGLSLEEARNAVETDLRRTLKRPQVSLTLHVSSGQIAGRHTIGPDGSLNLAAFGQVHVSGMTIREARQAIEKKLNDHFEKPSISLAHQSESRFQGVKPRDRAAAESKSVYVLEPPDIILVDPIRLLPKGPQRIERLDQLEIEVTGELPDAPIKGPYKVDADGEVSLGPEYGRVQVAGLTVKEAIQKIDQHLRKTLSDPAVALQIAEMREKQQVAGTHLIGPDGHVNLGTFGQVYVAGMTIDEARAAIEKKLAEHFEKPSVAVEVSTYNSKVYYVIVEGDGKGDFIHRFPLTGNENVIDALAQANTAIKNDIYIWIGRPADNDSLKPIVVDWAKLKTGELPASEYQLRAGDRVFLQNADRKPASGTKQRFPGGFAD